MVMTTKGDAPMQMRTFDSSTYSLGAIDLAYFTHYTSAVRRSCRRNKHTLTFFWVHVKKTKKTVNFPLRKNWITGSRKRWFPHSTFSVFSQWILTLVLFSPPTTNLTASSIDDDSRAAVGTHISPKNKPFSRQFYALFAIISWQFVFKHTTSVNEWVILRLHPVFFRCSVHNMHTQHTSASSVYAYASRRESVSQESGSEYK